ncbi:MAG: phosphoribosyltransferase [Bacteroidota bacterium]|jgi:putative phosphoribosyl transferase
MVQDIIADRNEAGKLLAEKLLRYKNKDAIVLAIPRGGVPVGFVISKHLNLPLDLVMSKKISHPYNPEFAIGSVCNDTVVMDTHSEVPNEYIEKEIKRIKINLKEKYKAYTGTDLFSDVTGKIVILVDDGIATGNTVLATIKMLRGKEPSSIVVAVPLIPVDNIDKIKKVSDNLVFLFAPRYFHGVGAFYKNYTQIEDIEVKKLLEENRNLQNIINEEEDLYFNEDFLL